MFGGIALSFGPELIWSWSRELSALACRRVQRVEGGGSAVIISLAGGAELLLSWGAQNCGRDKRARQKIAARRSAPDAADNERRQEPPDRRAARLRRAAPPRQDSRIHLQKDNWRGLLHRAPARARDNGALQQPRHDGRERPDNRDGEAHPPRRQQLPHRAARRAVPHAAALRRHAARRMARRAARGWSRASAGRC